MLSCWSRGPWLSRCIRAPGCCLWLGPRVMRTLLPGFIATLRTPARLGGLTGKRVDTVGWGATPHPSVIQPKKNEEEKKDKG